MGYVCCIGKTYGPYIYFIRDVQDTYVCDHQQEIA